MRYSILFAIALILISGFVAYFGDLLGRRMGKKRLTLWNLRPRHTAIIITTITGMMISALALATLIMAHSGFRKVFTEGERILARNEKLQSENAALASNRKRLEAEVEVRKREVQHARSDAKKARSEREKAIAAVARLEKDIAVKSHELAELKRRTDVTENELKAKTAELRDAQTRLNEAQENYAAAMRKVTEAESKLTTVEEKLKTTEERLQTVVARYEQLQAEKLNYEFQSILTREIEVIYQQGDELARGAIVPRQSEFGLRGDLYSLLERASTKAEKQGALQGSNGRAVVVVRHIYQKEPGREIMLLDDKIPEQILVNKAAEVIRTSPLDVVVQVVCGANSVRGEQTRVELKLWVNKLVYRSGGRITATTIDGRQSEGRILLKLSDFWKRGVSSSAVEAGIIPAAGPSAAESDPEAQVDELFRVLDQIKAVNAPARVTVYASSDIYAQDLLDVSNVRFEVGQAQ